MKQTIVVLAAVITLGVFNAFLLFALENKEIFEQKNIESPIPKMNREDNEQVSIEYEKEKNIRVLIKTGKFENVFHSKIEISSEDGLFVKTEEEMIEVDKAKCVKIADSAIITSKNNDGEVVIHSLERGDGNPSYKGTLELIETEKGIVIINEIPLEDYLCGVVPSEMPTSYDIEALKAQAICARSYAYNQMQDMAYPEYSAHVDDSVSFQVYNNYESTAISDQAVAETAGEMLWYGQEVAKTYFYSTSSGHSASIEAWGTTLIDANQYLQGVDIADQSGKDYEKELDWYRWSATIEEDLLEDIIEKNAQKEIGELKSIEITKRGTGNIVQQLEIRGSEDTIVVETENKIRKMLGGAGYQITKQDGSIVDSMNLLPSAFFAIEKSGECYIINGGGFGHGIGMSQSGANELAKNGKNYKDILGFFYPGTKVR